MDRRIPVGAAWNRAAAASPAITSSPTREYIMAEANSTIEDRVRERAYALWEKDGRPDGRSDQYWQQARSEVNTEDAKSSSESSDDATEKRQMPDRT
jgi:Protein of unknown function (DUF2934)